MNETVIVVVGFLSVLCFLGEFAWFFRPNEFRAAARHRRPKHIRQ
jgi:hypothetical protein